MTLNRDQTGLFNCMVLQQNESGNSGDFWPNMLHDNNISASIYNGWRTLLSDAENAYNETPSNLYGTHSDNTTYQIGGIGHFPHPPQKS